MQNRIYEIVSQLSEEISQNPETYFESTSKLYNKDYKKLSCSTNEEIFELSWIMFWHTCSIIAHEKINFLYQVRNDLLNHLNFYIPKDKADYLIKRLSELEKGLSINPLSEYLSFENYKNMFSQSFLQNLFTPYMQGVILPQIDEYPMQHYGQKSNKDIYIEIFDHYFDLTYKMMEDYLRTVFETKIIMYVLENNTQTSDKENPYPLVFQNREYYKFFTYCIKYYKQNNKVTPALISKLFMLFKYKGFLINGIKDVTFKDFLMAEFDLPINRIRKDRHIGSVENQYINLRKNYLERTGKNDL